MNVNDRRIEALIEDPTDITPDEAYRMALEINASREQEKGGDDND